MLKWAGREGPMTIRRPAVFAVFAVFAWLAPALRAAPARLPAAELTLANEHIRAVFQNRGLRSLLDRATGVRADFSGEAARVTVAGRTIELSLESPGAPAITEDRLTFTYATDDWRIRVVYEIRPGWRFVSKQIFIEPTRPRVFRVEEIAGWQASLSQEPAGRLPLTEGRFGMIWRFSSPGPAMPAYSLFALYQNPYNEFMGKGAAWAASYRPAMDWKAEYGPFASDRFLLGIVPRSGRLIPAKSVPEWKWVPDYASYLSENPTIDEAESEALVECVRAFLLYRPVRSIRVHVPWCENDYQIDVATPEGRAEYKRIIDRAAELGATHALYAGQRPLLEFGREQRRLGLGEPAFFSLGQKIRKGEWVPSRDPVPPPIHDMIDYGGRAGSASWPTPIPRCRFSRTRTGRSGPATRSAGTTPSTPGCAASRTGGSAP